MSKTKVTFHLSGMHCASCALNVDFALEDLAGVESAETSYAQQISVVQFNPEKITQQQIITTIQNLGYKVARAETK